MKCLVLCLLPLLASAGPIYGAWHCGPGDCEWASVPTNDSMGWLLNRGDGKPTVNVLSLAFLNPVKVLNNGVKGVPPGMTKSFINDLRSRGISVYMSIGGASWVSEWETALSDPQKLATNAVAIAREYNVGIEIDYEGEKAVPQLNAFVKAFSSQGPGISLTTDVDSDNGWIVAVDKAAVDWVKAGSAETLNAMVDDKPFPSPSVAEGQWINHLHGTSDVPALSGRNLTVALYAGDPDVGGVTKNCQQYAGSVLEGIIPWVKSNNVRGIMFWGPGLIPMHCPGIQQGSKVFLG